jgi:hypothetical protein
MFVPVLTVQTWPPDPSDLPQFEKTSDSPVSANQPWQRPEADPERLGESAFHHLTILLQCRTITAGEAIIRGRIERDRAGSRQVGRVDQITVGHTD